MLLYAGLLIQLIKKKYYSLLRTYIFRLSSGSSNKYSVYIGILHKDNKISEKGSEISILWWYFSPQQNCPYIATR